MNNARFSTALVGGNLPLICGRRHEYRPRSSTQFPVLLERMRDGARAADHLDAINGIFVIVLGWGEFADDLRPVCVQFVSQNHREGRLNSLTELKTIHLNNDLPVWHYLNESIRWIYFWFGLCT